MQLGDKINSSFKLISAMNQAEVTSDMIDKFLDGTKTATKTIEDIKADDLPF